MIPSQATALTACGLLMPGFPPLTAIPEGRPRRADSEQAMLAILDADTGSPLALSGKLHGLVRAQSASALLQGSAEQS